MPIGNPANVNATLCAAVAAVNATCIARNCIAAIAVLAKGIQRLQRPLLQQQLLVYNPPRPPHLVWAAKDLLVWAVQLRPWLQPLQLPPIVVQASIQLAS